MREQQEYNFNKSFKEVAAALWNPLGITPNAAQECQREYQRAYLNRGIFFGGIQGEEQKPRKGRYAPKVQAHDFAHLVSVMLRRQVMSLHMAVRSDHFASDHRLYPSHAHNIWLRRQTEKIYLGQQWDRRWLSGVELLKSVLFGEPDESKMSPANWLDSYDRRGPWDSLDFGIMARASGDTWEFFNQTVVANSEQLEKTGSTHIQYEMHFKQTGRNAACEVDPTWPHDGIPDGGWGAIRSAKISLRTLRPYANWVAGVGEKPTYDPREREYEGKPYRVHDDVLGIKENDKRRRNST